jgi:hypothetical protein
VIEGVRTRTYSPAKTIIDFFRYRQDAGKRYKKSRPQPRARRPQGSNAPAEGDARRAGGGLRAKLRLESRPALSRGRDLEWLNRNAMSAPQSALASSTSPDSAKQPFDLLLTRYVLERLLYGLSISTASSSCRPPGSTIRFAQRATSTSSDSATLIHTLSPRLSAKFARLKPTTPSPSTWIISPFEIVQNRPVETAFFSHSRCLLSSGACSDNMACAYLVPCR